MAEGPGALVEDLEELLELFEQCVHHRQREDLEGNILELPPPSPQNIYDKKVRKNKDIRDKICKLNL